MMSTLFGVPIFGLLAFLGTLLTYLGARRLARKSGIDEEIVVDGTLVIIVLGIAGCRLLHVIENWSVRFSQLPWTEVLRVDKGGLSWYGAFIFVLPAAFVYCWRKRLHSWPLFDLFILYTILGQVFGRIGCFMNGCCWGPRVDEGPFAALGVRFPTFTPVWAQHVQRHLGLSQLTHEEYRRVLPLLPEPLQSGSWPVLPTQLLLSVGAVCVLGIYLLLYGRLKKHGQVFAVAFTLLGLVRFTGELFRADSPRFGPLTDAQWYSLVAMAIGIALYLGLARCGRSVTAPGGAGATGQSPVAKDGEICLSG